MLSSKRLYELAFNLRVFFADDVKNHNKISLRTNYNAYIGIFYLR